MCDFQAMSRILVLKDTYVWYNMKTKQLFHLGLHRPDSNMFPKLEEELALWVLNERHMSVSNSLLAEGIFWTHSGYV